MKRLGHYLFAVGMAGLGLLSLIYDDFALVWQPVPEGVPGRAALAYVSGAILVAGGLGLLWRKSASVAAGVLATFVSLWLVLLQVPRVWGHPADEGMWLGFGETTILVSGAWTIYILSRRIDRSDPGYLENARHGFLIFYGLLLPVIGASHYVYTQGTAGMIPKWVPLPVFFAYLTGTGHMAAGLGIVFGVLRRSAAIAEAAMITCFMLLLHAPGVASGPHDRLQWTMLFVVIYYCGSAWAIAGAVPERRG
ncbi:MAG TPA: hypothetical protein VGG34_15425 [Opitutaceae bacterium]